MPGGTPESGIASERLEGKLQEETDDEQPGPSIAAVKQKYAKHITSGLLLTKWGNARCTEMPRKEMASVSCQSRSRAPQRVMETQ